MGKGVYAAPPSRERYPCFSCSRGGATHEFLEEVLAGTKRTRRMVKDHMVQEEDRITEQAAVWLTVTKVYYKTL